MLRDYFWYQLGKTAGTNGNPNSDIFAYYGITLILALIFLLIGFVIKKRRW